MGNNNLSAGDFEIINPNADITPPIADLTTLSVSQKTAVPGDTVRIRVKATDVGTGVDHVNFNIEGENGGSSTKSIYTPDEEGYYNFSFTVVELTQSGLWKPIWIVPYDKAGNKTYYFSSSADLSAGDFRVLDPTIPENPINAEVITSNTTWNYRTVDRDVYVGPDAILTINGNVKINGNIYVLGGVVSYGDLTVKNIYAHSFNWGYSSTINQGSFNARKGNYSIESTVISNFPIPNIPIEIYSSNEVTTDGYLPVIEGATLPIGDFYLEDELMGYNYNGTFSIRDTYVGGKSNLKFKIVDVFEKTHYFDFALNNPNPIVLESIEITKHPTKLVYVVGQSLDLTGMEVTGTYNDETTKVFSVTSANVTGFNSNAPVQGQILTITVDGKTATLLIDIIARSLESIEITKLPTKLTYVQGQGLDLTGIEVTGTYNDDTTENHPVTLDNMSGYDSSKPSTGQVVTVTVDNKSATFELTVIARELEAIFVAKQPDRTVYVTGQSLDLKGLEVIGLFNDETTEKIDITADQISGFDSTKPVSDQILTITTQGKTTTFKIDIIAKVLESIEITKQPMKLLYVEGQLLDTSGLEVIGTYNDGEVKVLDITLDQISGFDSSTPAQNQVVTVTVDGKKATFAVDIIARVLESIEITKQPSKLVYVVGQSLDLSGMEVTGTFIDGSTEILSVTSANVTGFNSSVPVQGETLTITVGGKTATLLIDIIARTLESIEITKLPTKLTYVQGQGLDLTGIEVRGNYNDETLALLAVNLDHISGFDKTKLGMDQVVTFTYEGKTATFTVDIIAKALDSIAITKVPAKLSYIVGQELDIAGIEVTGTYNDLSTAVLPVTLEHISGFDKTKPEVARVVTVTYEGKEATFTVDLIERNATEVKLNSYPAKVVYLVGETLDLTGLSLEATFNDGSREVLQSDDLTVTGFDSTDAVNNQVITITHGTWKFTYEITINPNLSVSAFAGNNRYHTAALISQATYEQSDIAILAQGMDFPDALAAGPLAKALNAPILLSRSDRLSPETEAELMRLGVKKRSSFSEAPMPLMKRLKQL